MRRASSSDADADQRIRASWIAPTLRGYQRGWLRPDIIAGATAGAVVIPQAMAYATIANLPVQVGLYTCMLPLVVYAFLGGSQAMSASTTSTIATLTATTLVSAGVATSSASALSHLVTLTLLVGILLLIARVFKLGTLVENINEATLVGIKIGLGATVALGQVPKLMGVDVNASGRGFIRTVAATVAAVPQVNVPTLLLSLGTIAALLLLRRFAARVPGQLVVVVIGIILGAFTGLPSLGVTLIPHVPTGLPTPALPALDHIPGLIPGALAIAIMAFLESASVARGIRSPAERRVDNNRELLAVGVASVVGSFFHTLPVAGGFSQSAVNLRAGARSQLSSLVTAALAVLVALFLAPILSNLPQATLASMVFVAVVGLVDVPGLIRFARISRTEFWICVVTAAIGLAAGLLAAVAAGVVFTLGAVLRELNRPQFVQTVEGAALTVQPQTALYTANVFATERAIEEILDREPGVAILVLDATNIRLTSVTVLDALSDFDRDLAGRDVRFEIVNLGGEALAMAAKTRWWRQLVADGRTGNRGTTDSLSPASDDPGDRSGLKA
jgi:MFS superfamily sulfate permease-like transporter